VNAIDDSPETLLDLLWCFLRSLDEGDRADEGWRYRVEQLSNDSAASTALKAGESFDYLMGLRL
jgi:hypothetical protein